MRAVRLKCPMMAGVRATKFGWYYFLHNLKDKGLVNIEYCPIDDMWGDYMSMPLHRMKFSKFQKLIMNL
jgi:hypothetical protein